MAKYLSLNDMISLGGGLPSSEYFPFDEMSIKVPALGQFSEKETHEEGTVLTAGKFDLEQEKSLFDIKTAFNYGQGTGAAQFLRFIIEHTEIVHNPPYQNWQSTMTIGSTSAFDVACRMFLEKDDYLLTEEYSFSSSVEAAKQMGARVLGVPMDEQGMLPSGLDSLLSNWNEAERGARKPFVVYTVPTGQNPSGATMSLQRRKDIYAVAQKHDLYILEDEPYYFLQMPDYTGSPDVVPAPPASHDEFLTSLVPSLLSLDTDGRVMRMDSFSKVISPGSRIGWITASAQIVDKYSKHADLSTQSPSGIAQLIMFKLLDEHWGHAGYLDWLKHMRVEYTRRRNVMIAACDTYLPSSVVSYVPPQAGMFHWMKVDYSKHPAYGKKSFAEIEEAIFMCSIKHRALVAKGSYFYADASAKHDDMFFRATYAAAPFDKINEAIRRFGEALREEFVLA